MARVSGTREKTWWSIVQEEDHDKSTWRSEALCVVSRPLGGWDIKVVGIQRPERKCANLWQGMRWSRTLESGPTRLTQFYGIVLGLSTWTPVVDPSCCIFGGSAFAWRRPLSTHLVYSKVRVLRKCPELVEDFVDRVVTLLLERSHGVVLCGVQVGSTT